MLTVLTVGAAMGWHRFVPTLGFWEFFAYYYAHGSVEPYLTFAINPRANIGGQGYPAVDLGIWLTDLFGLSLPSARAISAVYAVLTYGAMIVVFSRWFGLLPALLGATLTVFSTGYVFYSNFLLVVFPTLLISVLLVEACQRLARTPSALGVKVWIAFLLAMALIHYGMGRLFAVGWLAIFLAMHLFIAWREFHSPAAWRAHVFKTMGTAFGVVVFAAVILCVLEPRNAAALADIKHVFIPYPSKSVEYVKSIAELPRTLFGNIHLASAMIFPAIPWPEGSGIEGLIDGGKAPIFDHWHTPFILIGMAIALRRTFVRDPLRGMAYLSLHAIFLLSVGLALLSEQAGAYWTEEQAFWTLNPTRMFGVFFALCGYMTVAFAWIVGCLAKSAPAARAAGAVAFIAILAVAVPSIDGKGEEMRRAVDKWAEPDTTLPRFQPYPSKMPRYVTANSFIQARHRKLAAMIAARFDRLPEDALVILQIDPKIQMDRGKYHGLGYLSRLNDLSATLTVYLKNHGIDAAFVIAHSMRDKGVRNWGHGYGGLPRIFSGPIAWQGEKMVYRAEPPLRYVLKANDSPAGPALIVSFSDTETAGALDIAKRRGWQAAEPVMICDLSDLAPGSRPRRNACP